MEVDTFYKYMNEFFQLLLQPVLQNEAHWAHSENVLLAFLDGSADEKSFAKDIIVKIRESQSSSSNVRQFQKHLNFMPTMLKTLIKWGFVQEPPLIKDRRFVIEEMWKAIPCHSQAVELTIKLMKLLENYL